MCYSSSTRDVEHVLQYLQITTRLHSFEDEKRKIPALASCVFSLGVVGFQPSVCSASPIFTCSYQRTGIYFSTAAPVLDKVWVTRVSVGSVRLCRTADELKLNVLKRKFERNQSHNAN